MQAAQALLNAKWTSLEQIEAADKQLREAGLPDIDPFWVRWDYFVEQAKKANAPEKQQ